MTVKWKIFLALNFVLGLPALVFLALLLIRFIQAYHRSEDNLFFFMFLFALATIMFNSFLGILLIQRFYPDKLLTTGIKRVNGLSQVLTWIVAVGMLALCVYVAIDEFGSRYDHPDASGRIALGILTLALLLQVAVLVMQAQLPRLINRNNRNNMQSLIDAIGQ